MSTSAAKHPLHLVYTSDENYLFLTKVSVCSAFMQASRPTDLIIHLLDCGISDAMWDAWVKDLVERTGQRAFVRHRIDVNRFAGLREWKGTLATYARLCPPEALPNEAWCVYVDGDTLFTDDPFKLTDLFDSTCAMQGFQIWHEVRPMESWEEECIHKWYERHQMKGDFSHYVCTGFLLLNLDWWRANKATERCLDFLRSVTNDMPYYVDEMAMNFVCAGHVGLLPKEWGIFSCYAPLVDHPSLIHYILEAPHKTRFNRQLGFRDITAVWMSFVRRELGVSVKMACEVPAWKWALGRAYNRLLKYALLIHFCFPGGRTPDRVKLFQENFLRKKNRWLLSKRLWTRRWRGE